MVNKRESGEIRNSKGKCYIYPCTGKALNDVVYFGKSVKVCNAHKHVDGLK